jgi:hypothetical protein
LREFLNLINIPGHIRNYILMRKIENYSGKKSGHTFGVFLVDLLIIAMLAGAVYYICFINRDGWIKRIGLIVCGLFLLLFMVKITFFVKKQKPKYTGIKKLILTDDEGRNVKAWEIETKTSVLIGKKTHDNEVDVDLSDASYAALVSKEHAVLNFSDNTWYIEDLGSTNGSGVKRLKDNSKVKLKSGEPFKLCIGDIIYIANLKILVK